jgi:hypothetical protein
MGPNGDPKGDRRAETTADRRIMPINSALPVALVATGIAVAGMIAFGTGAPGCPLGPGAVPAIAAALGGG